MKESSLSEYVVPARLSPIRLPQYVRALAADSRDAVLLETSRIDAENPYSYLFLSPVETIAAEALGDLPAVFERIERALNEGLHVAGYVGYECGRHFALKHGHTSLHAKETSEALPLTWFGAYAKPFVFDHVAGEFVGDAPPVVEAESEPVGAVIEGADELRLAIDELDYVAAIERIKQYIEAGDTYQVNFTDAVTVRLPHPAAATFGALMEAQPVGYGALMNVAGGQILSLSPELFFRVDEGSGARRIVTRPMKGTMRRGLDVVEDAVQAALLAADEKNGSEHVMIVDLLRNDLGRICEMGSVRVEDIFTVERYRTLLQMTSTVSGVLREDVSWYEVFRALFPSGSITGAPKIRTMEIIGELERGSRGVYTGAIGYIAPSGAAQFNVAIRTLVLQDDVARMGVGGGIVADSEAQAEYRECQLKASFLRAERTEFELIETMLAEDGAVKLLAMHLDRLAASAEYFEFAFDRAEVEAVVADRLGEIPSERFRMRLLLDRLGCVKIAYSLAAANGAEASAKISQHAIDSHDGRLRHKTTLRALYDSELALAHDEGFDEVLFLNERGELTEGAISTLFVRRGGEMLTPPLASGVLPGVLRRSILESDVTAREQVLTLDDLREAEAVFIGNSLRGLRRVTRVEDAGGRSLCAPLDASSV